MPFMGKDWRSPGEQWIRTELGWTRFGDNTKSSFSAQAIHQLHHIGQRASPSRSINEKSSRPASPLNESQDRDWLQDSDSMKSKCIESRDKRKLSGSDTALVASKEREKRLVWLHLVLSQRCVFARSSSKERSHYCTIADAIDKLNFEKALLDDNCFPFICKVVAFIYDNYQSAISGSLRIKLFRITELAKEIVDLSINSKKHSGLVLNMVDYAIATLKKVRRQQFTSFAIHNTDSKLKYFLKMKRQLQSSENEHNDHCHTFDLASFPSDCYRKIIAYLTHPKDVLNFGLVNSTLHSITEENWIWMDLTRYHYGQTIMPKASSSDTSSNQSCKDDFAVEYRQNGGRLRDTPTAACLCKICNFVFWKSYGHPCSTVATLMTQPAATAGVTTHKHKNTENEAEESSHRELTVEQFLQLFAS